MIVNKTSRTIEIWIGDDFNSFPSCSPSELPKWQLCSGKLTPVLPDRRAGVTMVVSPAVQAVLKSRDDLKTAKEVILIMTQGIFTKDGIYATRTD